MASEEKVRTVVENRLLDEIRRGVQTIQYQVVTLMTTNGQAPFVTVFMYLNEARTAQEKHDLALIIEETLRQRYEGVKNEAGVWITPAFPKLIYVLEDDNIEPRTSSTTTSPSLPPSARPSAWCPTTSPRRRCASSSSPRARRLATATATPAWAAAAS